MGAVAPLANRVLVKRLRTDWRSAGGIVLPLYVPGDLQQTLHTEETREHPLAEVLALADHYWEERERKGFAGVRRIAFTPRLKVGDVVALDRYAGSDIEAIGNACLPHWRDILGKWQGDTGALAEVRPLDATSGAPAISDAELDAEQDPEFE